MMFSQFTRSLSVIASAIALASAGNSLASPQWVKPMAELETSQKTDFWTGFSLFRSPWVAAPASTKGRDGLGPLFNARSCDACHHNGAGGKTPGSGFGSVLRLSVYDKANNTYIDHPRYGGQLQTNSIASMVSEGQRLHEASLDIQWQSQVIENKTLKRPKVLLSKPNYGEFGDDMLYSLRVAPPLFGLGLVDALSEEEILSREDIHDSNNDGISGKANRVWDIQKGKHTVGRFGHKAEQPNLLQQIAAAFNADIGLSSWLYPMQNCSPMQKNCLSLVTGNSTDEGVEISRNKLKLVHEFSRFLQAPATTNKNPAVFEEVGCHACHINKAISLDAPFKGTQVVFFSDFLLHDLGEALSDSRPVGQASAKEWRTTPLWGISRKLSAPDKVFLLHDGRAENVEQAILWHGGEAAQARKKFLALSKAKQKQLIEYINAL